MNAVFILDDCRANAEQLSATLQALLADGCHCLVLDDLKDFRRQSRRFHAGLVLVELMQAQRNGFELAATLSRQSRFQVVLCSAREQPADLAWAAARGIRHVVNRRLGLVALSAWIVSVLEGKPPSAQATAGSRIRPLPPVCSELAGLTAPQAATDSLDAARQQLRALCGGAWSELVMALEADHPDALWPWPDKIAARWQELCSLLGFLRLPVPATDLTGVMALGATLGVEYSSAHSAEAGQAITSALVSTVCQQALHSETDQPMRSWQQLASLVLMLRHTGCQSTDKNIQSLCHESGAASMAVLYDPPDTAPGIIGSTGITSSAYHCWRTHISDCLHHLPVPARDNAGHWLVSMYKLRSFLETRLEIENRERPEPGGDLTGWYHVVHALYRIFCHLQVPRMPGSQRPELPWELCDVVLDLKALLSNPGTHGLPPESAISRLMALDLCFALSGNSDHRAEQQSLAGGLRLLSRPAQLVSMLASDSEAAGTLLTELLHELSLLLEGARRWQVVRVESLVALLMLCYRQIQHSPDLLGHRRWRLVLGRAHRQLCRMLDQAACWQNPAGKRDSVQINRLIDDMFGLLNPQDQASILRDSVARDTSARDNPARNDPHRDWLDCLRLNRRLKQLLEQQRREQMDYSTLIRSVLSEQHGLIQRRLAGIHVV